MGKLSVVLLLLLSITAANAQVVTTTEQLLQAIQSNRHVSIQPGTYRLEKLKGKISDTVAWSSGTGVVIKGVKNLMLEANGDVKILSPDATAAVLTFVDCEDVSIKGVIAGHTPEVQFCVGGVFDLTRCRGFKIKKSVLFGCGTRGLSLDAVNDLLLEDSVIKECTVDIISAHGCNNLRFIKCEFKYNKYISTPLAFYDCSDVIFEGSVFEENRPEEENYGMSMFSVDKKSQVTVRACMFRRNRANEFEDRRGSVLCDDALFEENAFGYEAPLHKAANGSQKQDFPFRSITVNTVTELLKEIRPNEEIKLAAKEFLLDYDKVKVGNNPFAALSSDHNGLHLKGLHSFKLIGADGTRIISPSEESAVVTLTDCRDCAIEGMSLGHVPFADGCYGPVLSVTNAEDIVCRNCVLFGCGTEGVVLESVKSFQLEDSTIEKCTAGLASLYRSKGEFIRVRIAGNKSWGGLNVSGKSALKIFSSQIFDNQLQGGNLFDLDSASSVEVHNSMIVGNKAANLHQKGVDINFIETKLRDNNFTEKQQ